MSLSLPLTIGGIACKELHQGSGKASVGEDGYGTADRIFACAWADRNLLMIQLIGDVTQDAGGTVTIIPRSVHPSYSGMYGAECEIEPMGKPSATNTWPYAKLTVKYKSMPNGGSFNPTDLKEENVELSGEVLTEDGTKYLFDVGEDDAGKTPDGLVKKVIPHLTYAVTMYRVTALPVSAISVLGKLNAATFKGFGVGKCMYEGFVSTRKTQAGGQNLWTISHHFKVSPFDLRTILHNGKMQKVKTRDGGNYLYDTADFSTLGVGT